MMAIDGRWELVVKSPLGDQKSTLAVTSDGKRFSGTNSGVLGSIDVEGTVDGDTVAWKQQVVVPMPLLLDLSATIDGDTLTGTVGVGAFGTYPMSGRRVG